MGISLSAIVIVLIYAISVNFALIEFARFGIGIDCPSAQTNYNSTEIRSGSASVILEMITARCQNLPLGLFLILELPIIVGIAYIIRGFIGAT